MSDTPKTDAFREVIFAQYKEDELTGDGMGNLLSALTDIETLERERDEARQLVKELTHENENLYRRLESVHEVYRLSSVCRGLKAENDKLKTQLEERELYIERVITWPHDADPFTSPDHDNDSRNYQ